MDTASDKSKSRLEITVSDREALKSSLDLHKIPHFQTKSDVATIVIALGGGVGIAAIVRQIGLAIQHYFEGLANLAKAEGERAKAESQGLTKLAQAERRKLIIKVSGKSKAINVTSTNAGEIESEILSELGIAR
jgi:hypothetical protein